MPNVLDPFDDAVSAERWYGGTDCPPDGGFLWRITQLRLVQQGDQFPEGYGLAWFRENTAEVIVAPLPWNLVIGALYRLSWWMRVGFGRHSVLAEAWKHGVDWERANGNRRLRQQARDFELTLLDAKREQFDAGKRAMLRILQSEVRELKDVDEIIRRGKEN